MHNSYVEYRLIFDYEISQLAFLHSIFHVQVIQNFYVSVKFKRRTLSFRLFNTQTWEIIFEFIIDKVSKEILSLKFRKFILKPVKNSLIEILYLCLVLLWCLFLHLYC